MPAAAMVAGMLAIVYVAWGSTSPAMRVAVATVPPFWMAALRFAIAGTLMWAWCRLRGVALPNASEVRGAALTGFVLLVLSNALFAWTLQYLPSGIGSLVFALSPLWMALFAFALERERLTVLGGVGLALGLGGMAFLFSPAGAQHLPALPAALALFASLAWGLGSILQRRFRSRDVVQNSALQMLCASAVLVVVALATGEQLRPGEFAAPALGSIAYLVIFGSIVGFSSYLWLMNNVPTTLASTYAYVNPVVALAIGIGLLHESGSARLLLGAAVILAGVALMVLAPKPRTQA